MTWGTSEGEGAEENEPMRGFHVSPMALSSELPVDWSHDGETRDPIFRL